MRTFQPEVQDLIERRLHELCSAIALGFGATATVHYERVYPGHHQHARARPTFAADVAESLVGADHVVRDMEPSMGAEDFSFMLQVKPGAYLRIGQGGEGSCFLHNSRYDFNDEILPLGSALHAGLIEQSMPLATLNHFDVTHHSKEHPDEIQTHAACGRPVRRLGAISLGAGADDPRSPTRAMRCRWTRTRSTSRCS